MNDADIRARGADDEWAARRPPLPRAVHARPAAPPCRVSERRPGPPRGGADGAGSSFGRPGPRLPNAGSTRSAAAAAGAQESAAPVCVFLRPAEWRDAAGNTRAHCAADTARRVGIDALCLLGGRRDGGWYSSQLAIRGVRAGAGQVPPHPGSGGAPMLFTEVFVCSLDT